MRPRQVILAEIERALSVQDPQQCCADYGQPGCLEMVPVSRLYVQADGRRICINCKRLAVQKAADRAQNERMFDQARLF